MVVVTNQIEQARACYTPTNDDYIGCTFEDFYTAKSPFTLVQKFIILMVISHDQLGPRHRWRKGSNFDVSRPDTDPQTLEVMFKGIINNVETLLVSVITSVLYTLTI